MAAWGCRLTGLTAMPEQYRKAVWSQSRKALPRPRTARVRECGERGVWIAAAPPADGAGVMSPAALAVVSRCPARGRRGCGRRAGGARRRALPRLRTARVSAGLNSANLKCAAPPADGAGAKRSLSFISSSPLPRPRTARVSAGLNSANLKCAAPPADGAGAKRSLSFISSSPLPRPRTARAHPHQLALALQNAAPPADGAGLVAAKNGAFICRCPARGRRGRSATSPPTTSSPLPRPRTARAACAGARPRWRGPSMDGRARKRASRLGMWSAPAAVRAPRRG